MLPLPSGALAPIVRVTSEPSPSKRLCGGRANSEGIADAEIAEGCVVYDNHQIMVLRNDDLEEPRVDAERVSYSNIAEASPERPAEHIF